jgi:hypothetical protein
MLALAIIDVLLLFAFFDSIEFLNDSLRLARLETGARILDESDEALR